MQQIERKKYFKTLTTRYKEVKNELLKLVELFEIDFDDYIDTYHVEKFERNDNETLTTNLRNSETTFDKNYETVVKNMKLIENNKEIFQLIEELSFSMTEMMKQIERENEELIHLNNETIETIREIMKDIQEEEVSKRPFAKKTIERNYEEKIKLNCDPYKFETLVEKQKKQIIQQKQKKEKEKINQKMIDEKEKIKKELKRSEEQRKHIQKELHIQSIFENSKRIMRNVKDYKIFKMDKSSIDMHKVNELIVVNKYSLLVVDQNDSHGYLPVEQETVDFLTIGSLYKGNIFIEITTKEICEKYTIRTEPSIISLKNGEAFEFKIFITPLCTTTIKNDEIMINVYEPISKKHFEIPFTISFTSQESHRIDPDELKEEKTLSESKIGSISIGTFRKNKVLIKKVIERKEHDETIVNFKKENDIFDELENDYTIKYYGASFIPGKICRAIEYSPIGTIQQLISNEQSNKFDEIMKVKFLVDASRGIEYLHSLSIMHRNIKPDKFMVVSLDSSIDLDTINVKLSDFSNARKIDVSTTMKFTKGIGTPSYMAPEMWLKKGIYDYSVDIYSFAVTMLEIMTWNDAFPKSEFQFAWDISNLIQEGKRPDTINNVENITIKKIIQSCWQQEPGNRFKATEIVGLLQSEWMKLSVDE